MLVLTDKNGRIRLLSDGRPVESTAIPAPEEREKRYACIRERMDEICGVERAPLLKPDSPS